MPSENILERTIILREFHLPDFLNVRSDDRHDQSEDVDEDIISMVELNGRQQGTGMVQSSDFTMNIPAAG